MAYGTAPRRIGGVWYTRTGRRVPNQAYWERKHQQGFVTTTGHTRRTSVGAGATPPGLVTKGNIDIRHRPNVPTPGRPGMHSSVRSITVTDDKGRAHLIPTVVGNRVVSKAQAVAHWRKTGQHLGVFETEAQANAYAGRLHRQQARQTRPVIAPQEATVRPGVKFEKPSYETFAAAKRGDRGALQKITNWNRHTHAVKQADEQTNRMVSAQFGGAEQIAARAHKTVNPVAGAVIKALSPYTSAKETVSAIRHRKPVAAGVAALGILPVGPGRARALAKGVKAGMEAEDVAKGLSTAERMANRAKHRTLVVGKKAVQMPGESPSRLVRPGQRALDRFSMRHADLPVLGSVSRGTKQASRNRAEEMRRSIDVLDATHARHLPRPGSASDIAHSWWAQYPPRMRTPALLHAVRDKYQKELDALTTGAQRTPRGKLQRADQETRARDLSIAIAQMDKAIEAKPKLDPKVIDAVQAFSEHRKATLVEHGILDPTKAADREELPLRWLTGASYVERTPGRLGKPSGALLKARQRVDRLQVLHDRALSRSKAKNAVQAPATRAQAIERLDRLEREHESFIQSAIKERQGPGRHDPSETARRNLERGLYKRTGGLKGHARPTLAQEFRDETIATIDRLAEANKSEPWAKSYIQQRDEIAHLRTAIHDTHPAFGDKAESQVDFGKVARHAGRSQFDPTVTKLGGALSVAKDEASRLEGAAAKRVGPTGIQGGMREPGGIFIGHRDYKPPAMQRVLSMGKGKVRAPEGVARENKMGRLSSGRLRMSTHVAREDFLASQTFHHAKAIRDDLSKMASPILDVVAHIPDKPLPGYSIINPEGKVFPRAWKSDMLAQAADEKDLASRAKEVMDNAVSQDAVAWKAIVDEARATGVADKLRIIPTKQVEKYYSHFLPATRPGKWLKGYDRLTDAAVASIIIGRAGFIPKQIVQNVVMAVPGMGLRVIPNLSRGIQLSPLNPKRTETDKHLFKLLWSEVSGGAGGAVSMEAAGKPLRALGRKSTEIGDSLFRVSAMLHALANQGTISKIGMHLSEHDKENLLHILTHEKGRRGLNQAMQESRDLMGDFNRLSPSQRSHWRRLVMVPNWLVAGTRYTAKFPINRPLTTAGLAYVAAGEPGSPKKLNRPVDELLAKGLPNWVEGIPVGKGKTQPITSIFPSSIPADVAFKLRKGQVPLPGDYPQAVIQPLWDTAHSQVTGSHGTYHVSFGKSLQHNVERMMPTERFVRDIVSPPKEPKTYRSDRTRLGRLERELGGPAEYEMVAPSSRDKAKVLSEKLGVSMPPEVKIAYQKESERAKAWKDATHGKKSGTRDYYVSKYKADLDLAEKWGYYSKAQADAERTQLAHMTYDDVRKAHLSLNGDMYDVMVQPAREYDAKLKALQGYSDMVDSAVKAGVMTRAQGAREKRDAKGATAEDLQGRRDYLERVTLGG